MKIRAFLMGLIVALMTITGFTQSPAQADSKTSVSASNADSSQHAKKGKKSKKCDAGNGSFVTPNGITVLSFGTCFDVKLLKKMGCDTEAGKNEQPAPPRDPKSICKGKAHVKFKINYETPTCPPGTVGGKLTFSLLINQSQSALGLSKSIASGRVDTWARTKIKMLDKFKGAVVNTCVQVPPVCTVNCTPPPVCTTNCTPPCTSNCTPETPQPTITKFRVKNDLEVNAKGEACASWQIADGRSATLSFDLFYGTVDGTSTFVVTGSGEKCVTIVAPSEVPQGDAGAGIPAGKDKVYYVLIDNESGKKDEKSAEYTVHPTATHPA